MNYSFTDFKNDIDRELLALVGKSTVDFPEYNFEADFDTGWSVALSAKEAILSNYNLQLPELDYLTRDFVRDECGIFGATLDDAECDPIIIETLRLYFRGEFQHTGVYWIANALTADEKIHPQV